MSNRWKVTRAGFPTWRPGEHWWQVQELDDDGYWYAAPDGMFSHFAPALAYADRMARTITVTLPRVGRQTQIPVPEDYGNERPISVGNHGDFISAVFTAQGLTQDVAIHPEELEPLALTLLALARKEKA